MAATVAAVASPGRGPFFGFSRVRSVVGGRAGHSLQGHFTLRFVVGERSSTSASRKLNAAIGSKKTLSKLSARFRSSGGSTLLFGLAKSCELERLLILICSSL